MLKKLLFFALILFSVSASANNIQVANVSLQEGNKGTQVIQFDVTWENSWRTGSDIHDGAWIIAKFRKTGASNQPWHHCTLRAGGVGGTGAVLEVTTDGIGAFIYMADNKGVGNVVFDQNQLIWNSTADGVGNGESVEVKVFALEMVYIPQGAFYVGNGGTERLRFHEKGNNMQPFYIANNDPFNYDAVSHGLFGGSPTNTFDVRVSADYPKGYNAFWSMKYEISVQQFLDFLNHIPKSYSTEYLAAITIKDSHIADEIEGTWPELVSPFSERAMNCLSQNMFINMARWLGMRPMSEMEFEKICRGANITPVPDEYPWGTTKLVNAETFENVGRYNESVVTPKSANAYVGSDFPFDNRPLRVGIFARPSGSNRELSGAAYYGTLNMGDNVSEWVGLLNISGESSPLHEKEHGLGQFTFDNITTDHFSDARFYLRGANFSYQGTYGNEGARTSDRGEMPSLDYLDKDFLEIGGGGRFVRTADE